MDQNRLFLFLLYGAGVVQSFHNTIVEYYFINSAVTWPVARDYCRTHYTDLAIFRNKEDIGKVTRPYSYSYAWIGLFDDPESWKGVMTNSANSWRWSATGTTGTSHYMKWSPLNSGGGAGETCVYIRDGGWHDYSCSSQLSFACFKSTEDSSSKQFTLVLTLMTWKNAQIYCRQHHTDLAMIEDEAENAAVAALKPSANVWIGLYRVPWRWNDGSTNTYTNWDRSQPKYFADTHYVVENLARYWHDARESLVFPFICHKALKKRVSKVQLKLQTGVGLSDPANAAQILAQVIEVFKQKGITDIKMQWTLNPMLKE